jgi:hypothetical protein
LETVNFTDYLLRGTFVCVFVPSTMFKKVILLCWKYVLLPVIHFSHFVTYHIVFKIMSLFLQLVPKGQNNKYDTVCFITCKVEEARLKRGRRNLSTPKQQMHSSDLED